MADGSIQITAGSGTPIRALTNAGVQSGASQQVMSLADQYGILLGSDPDGTLNFSSDPATLFIDSFDVSLANFTSGGTAPTVASSVATFASSTTASGASYLRTNGQFMLQAGAYLRDAQYVRFDAAAVTNTTRWWGLGSNQASPTAAAPVLNGAVFVLDYADGALYACTYNAGTQTKVATLTRPTDAAQHRYDIWYRQTVVYWLIDGVPVASVRNPALGSWLTPYWVAGQVNHTTAPSAAPILSVAAVSVSDTGGNTRTLSDGLLPYLRQTVKAASTAVAATDLPAAVGLHPSSPLPAGTNTIGSTYVAGAAVKASSTAAAAADGSLVVALHPSSPLPAGTNALGTVALGTGTNSVGALQSVTGAGALPYSLVTTASTNAAVVKSAAGSLFELTISNVTATVVYVKLYNKGTAPTVGTDVPVMTVPVLATGNTAGLDFRSVPLGTNGKRFTSGIAIAVTAAAAATDTAAAVAGVQVHGSYV